MGTRRKTHQIIEDILLVLAILLTVTGCEKKLIKDSELKKSTELIQSLNEVNPDAAAASVVAGDDGSDVAGAFSSKGIKVVVEWRVPVPMRDGTILRADVYRPDRGGPYPVLVKRSMYRRQGASERLVKAGYIIVDQSVRGRYGSGGNYEWMVRVETHDAEDGYDTVEWAARLSGSSGKVGTFGSSYDAFVQWRLAALNPPSLVAMNACSIPAQKWYGDKASFRPGFHLEAWASHAIDMRRQKKLPGVQTDYEHSILWEGESDKWIHWLPWADLPQDFFGYETYAFKDWLRDPYADPWKLDEGCRNISVPNLDIVGWYDYAHGDLLLYRTMVREAKTEQARTGSRVIIGPWPHTTFASRYGNINFGPTASFDAFDKEGVMIRWFDYWLKGEQNGVDKDLPVKIFVMGDNEWRDEAHWPLQRAEEEVLFINSGSAANTPEGDGRLLIEKPVDSKTDIYVYDPLDPVPTPYGAQRPVPTDQRVLADRQDILVYQTEPLTERVEVTGNPRVELFASTSAPDTDWFVRLIDVAPDGLARDISSGVMRARYRNGFEKPELIVPGSVVQYSIRMMPTSNAFLPGHRIRLDITSSDFPNFDRNHNTAANQNTDSALATAQQTVYHGGEYATCIVLPLVSNRTAQGAEEGIIRPVAVQPAAINYPLHEAVASGDIDKIKILLSEGADINGWDNRRFTPLYRAVEAEKTEAVDFLLEAGADINAGVSSPLYAAVYANNTALAKRLIDHGADPHPSVYWSPLVQAAYSGNIEMIKLLIDAGADMNTGELRAWNMAIYEGREEVLDLLIQKGLIINTEDENGMTPLVVAVLYDKTNIIEKLVDNGARIDHRNDLYEFTALHYAARFGKRRSAEALIAHGANIAAKDKWDYQPIHWAAYHDRPNIIELLIAKGADVNAQTSLGQMPLQLAIPRKNTAAIEVLRNHGAKD
jgi:putative CocE/NonD family hydrolase